MTERMIGHYRLIEKLGEGGMGVVYKAEDVNLKRIVALKCLPEYARNDLELRGRFLREAQAAASLSHPNVCVVYEIDEPNNFIAMELLEGQTVAARIAQRPLPIAEALDIAIQSGMGLQAAHQRGVVHRDIKPSNLMIAKQGVTKIMDFGLARLTDQSRVTRTSAVLGTPAYMSPEQVRGEDADARSDIWGLGVVLYEMISGQRPFKGEMDQAVSYAIVNEAPEPLSALRSGVPLELDRVVDKALAKDRNLRYQHVDELLVDLKRIQNGVNDRAPKQAKSPAWKTPALAAAALAGVIVGAAALWGWQQSRATPPAVVRFAFDLPEGQRMRPTWNPNLAFTPDGKVLGYSIGPPPYVYLKRLDELEPKAVPAPGLGIPAFSPDGREMIVMDMSQMTMKRIALTGAGPRTLSKYDMAFRGSWAPDNYYYWTSHYFGPIIRTPVAGGKDEPVTELDLEKQERTHRHAHVLPDGKSLLFTVVTGGIDTFDDARIDAFQLSGKRRKTVIQGGFAPQYSSTGHVLYARGGGLYAVRYNASSMEASGSPLKIADNVFMSTNTGSAWFAISPGGTLAYAIGKTEGGERTLVWVDRKGNATPLPLPARSYLFPRISPGGKLMAVEVEGTNHDLYTHDFDRGVTTKMTTDGLSHAPVWSPDGKNIGYRSWKAGNMTMWQMPADRSGPEQRLTTYGARQSLVAYSPDGNYATYTQMEPNMDSNVWVLPLKAGGKPQPVLQSKFREGSGRFSRDGKWIAYCTDESGKPEVFVQPWPGPGPRIQISSDGGTDPIWSRDGTELFYRNDKKMMVVKVDTSSGFRAGRPELLWEGEYSHGLSNSCGMPGATSANYDVSPDGQRFLMVRDVDQNVFSTRIVIVLNFSEEIRRRFAEQKAGAP